MVILKTTKEAHRNDIPEVIKKDCILTLKQIEECNQEEDRSFVAILAPGETIPFTTKQAETSPQVDVYIGATNWRKRVYILSDYGDGIVVYNLEEASKSHH